MYLLKVSHWPQNNRNIMLAWLTFGWLWWLMVELGKQNIHRIHIDLGEKYQDQGNLLLGRNTLLGRSSKHSALQTLIYISYALTNYLTFKNPDDCCILEYFQHLHSHSTCVKFCLDFERKWSHFKTERLRKRK